MSDGVTTEAGRALPNEPLSAAGEAKLRATLDRLLAKSGYLTGCEQMNARLLATLDARAQAVENERRRLYEAVEGLPGRDVTGLPRDWTGGGTLVNRRAVLALLAPPAEKEQT